MLPHARLQLQRRLPLSGPVSWICVMACGSLPPVPAAAPSPCRLAAQLEALVAQLAQASSKQRRTIGMADLNKRNADMNFKAS